MIYTKTASGQAALFSRALTLTPRQRAAFIMFDGRRSLNEVLKATAGMGITAELVNQLVAQGLLAATGGAVAARAAPPDRGPAAAPLNPVQNAQAHYSKAYPIAARLTAGLGLRGFMLNLAVEGANDLVKLQELAPKIMKAVGPEKFRGLGCALYD
jgi:hypothetical protein